MTADRKVIDFKTRQPFVIDADAALTAAAQRAATEIYLTHNCHVLVIMQPLEGESLAYTLGCPMTLAECAANYVANTLPADAADGA